jgi:hypothetical protein
MHLFMTAQLGLFFPWLVGAVRLQSMQHSFWACLEDQILTNELHWYLD